MSAQSVQDHSQTKTINHLLKTINPIKVLRHFGRQSQTFKQLNRVEKNMRSRRNHFRGKLDKSE